MLALLGGGVQGYRHYDLSQRTTACEASGDEIDEAWSEDREQALRDALLATGVSHAATTADKLMVWLDRQTLAWRDARIETCLDTDVRDRWDVESMAPNLLFDAATILMAVLSELARHEDARRWGRHAELALAKLPDREQLAWARLSGELGANEREAIMNL